MTSDPVMIDPDQQRLVLNAIIHSSRPRRMLRVWGLAMAHIQRDTGAITVSIHELAEDAGTTPEEVTEALNQLAVIGPAPTVTLLANSEAAVWTAMLGGKLRSKPRCLIGFWASSGLIVDFANSVNSRVTKGHLKSEVALLIEIAHVFARSDVFGSGFPIMDHILHVLDPGSTQLCTCILHRKNSVKSVS
jgi:hypothetical protein